MRDPIAQSVRPIVLLGDLSNASRTWEGVATWLAAGANSPQHSFHWPVVSTIGADRFPESRVVVLRKFDGAARELTFHTDARSPKVQDLQRDSRCGFLLYDPEQRLQLRVRTVARLHRCDDHAQREFAKLAPHNRATYACTASPSAELPAQAPFDYPPKPPIHEEEAFQNFTVVNCQILELDVLELHELGHRRAKLWWDDATVRMQRVAP
jgi:pyridoxamine 5'-phosphate oxidase